MKVRGEQEQLELERAARAADRRARMEVNVAYSWEEAETWDLEFWQARTPEQRLGALAALQRDAEAIRASRDQAEA